MLNNRLEAVKKFVRYLTIYGVSRSFIKVLGRTRPNVPLWPMLKFPFYNRNGKTVGIVGAGHHAYSSLAYYLTSCSDARISFVIDIDHRASATLAYAYGSKDMGEKFTPEKFSAAYPEIVYIASNHASHAEYAEQFISNGCDVFIEKPVAIDRSQLMSLSGKVKNSNCKIYAGYNRPHSAAINIIRGNFNHDFEPLTLSCFVVGHFIPPTHWYRDPSEGTRVVANLGHWIDLATHILSWREFLPEYLDIMVAYSNTETPSDNISISMVSPNHDLVNIVFTSRGEPFEGVNETICFQQGDLLIKIDDFRTTKLWKGSQYKKYRHWPKDNGHRACVLQPFKTGVIRHWGEIEQSTSLMLHVEEMVKSKMTHSRFIFS